MGLCEGSHLFAKPLMEKGEIVIWCVVDHKILSLIRSHVCTGKGNSTLIPNYCYFLASIRWKMSNSQPRIR